ncbi:Acidobacterial duplicated orphan permease [Terriglobus roseus DSM 18391]|uniref:Acidobacterial duplicated orphan permease n=1 Tax=Terriglobus roseus (strain DSM 18391 / NRRL B-41598 / KBS 63) TaxID=926566 RepID=I3ZHD9_TERRK|nr:ABC transporter permease [Terriglobus roseus]AFL88315.1 Acidobacterial duplicated orphan permease [Terriglobus roseus DSM 18391]AFL88657.1 Acidobacterial duplicated orphan permease [Terriglobus roseus DSM 18391]
MIAARLSRLRFFFRKRPSTEVEEEIRAHLAESMANKMGAGMSLVEARRLALIEFGGIESAREQVYRQHPRAWLDTLRQDLRFAARSLKRDRGFTTIAVLILALGMGANIAVFSLVNTILLRPLPFRNPGQVVWLQPAEAGGGLSGATYSSDAYEDLRDRNQSFSGVTGYFAFSAPNNLKLTGSGIPTPITGIGVIPNLLDVLQVPPQLGRGFRMEDGRKGASPVVMLSHAFWMTHFHGDRDVVDQAISVDGKPATIIGVLPAAFDFGATFSPGTRVDVLSPFSLDEGRDWGNIVTLIARLKPGVTTRQAEAESATLFPQLYWSKKQADSKGGYKAVAAVPMKEHVAGPLRRSLYVLWSAVAMILLIVCVNLSNLLLGRAATRSKEFALRFALGASRQRIIRQLLTESLLLSFAGAAIGIALAAVVTQWLAHQGSLALPLISELRIDMPTLLWTVLLGIGATLLFGVVPSLRITADANLQATLKDSGPGASEGRKHEGLRNALIISEVALACVLVVGAGLLLRSFLKVMEIDLGFQPSHAATISVEMPDLKTGKAGPYYRNLLQQVSAIPGIQSAGIADNLPLARNRTWGAPGIKGVHYGPNERMPTFVYMITPGYMEAMAMHLRGRDFSWQDDDASEPVIILNERAARMLFPSGDALDHMVDMSGKERRIVGVVPDVHETDVEASSAWQVYFPVSQLSDMSGVELVVRSNLSAATLQPTLLKLLRRTNPAQGAVDVRPMQALVDHSTSPRRFFAWLVGLFAASGVVLACLGIYGVISYSVTRQTQEIGIRMALGASPASVLRSVLQRTLRLAGIGIAVGTVAAILVAKGIAAMLYGTEATDPMTFAAMLVSLLVVSLAAGYFPARRAAHINPLVALRTQ